MLTELEGRASEINRQLQQQNETLGLIAAGVQQNKAEMEKQQQEIKRAIKR
ncbi:synaptosomal-associated protein 25, putative [Eimeria tenella]|uniref:Synaptosomal-associated protein 25, putative n=1 Tax=Eimeria tenella TaxID=5802 RepID=U6L641_EIMTE|nr:synaptosomal-associated protein 25, putative [Eimeria tenella]CDJ44668.1 synaptosomal-associated protein 25, putative [Eimeria tenella]|eukprot:XP_013235416.1 synaptosomal-associated protein 25, putative [Eimeria tenella]